MTFAQFILLPPEQQDAMLIQAVRVAVLHEGKLLRELFQLHSFYIEKLSDGKGAQIELNAFEMSCLLDPYLEQFDISEWIRP